MSNATLGRLRNLPVLHKPISPLRRSVWCWRQRAFGALLLSAAAGPLLETNVAVAAPAADESAESMVLIRPLTGPDAEALQVTVEAAVAEYYSAVSASPAEETELAKGSAAMIAMSREKKYRAYVSGTVKKGPRGRTLVLTVYSGKDGKSVGQAKFPGANAKLLDAKVDAQAGKVLANLLKRTHVAGEGDGPPPAADAEQGDGSEKVVVTLEEEPEAQAPEAEPVEPEGPRPSPLDVNAAFGFTNLSLTYTEPVADSFNFELQPRPSTPLTFRLGGAIYPGAFFVSNGLADIGLSARYYQSVGGTIKVNGTPYDVSFKELDVGLRARVRFDGGEVGAHLGWGRTRAIVEGDNGLFTNRPALGKDPGLFPDMDYSYIRVGADGRAHISGPFSLLGGLALRLPEVGDKLGQLGEKRWFPRASAGGVDVEVAGLYELIERLSLTVGVDARIYGLTMHSSAEDIEVSAIAGGAQDRYLSGFVGVDYRL